MIYLDNAATTPVAAEVLSAMQPFFEERYGNPSSLHQAGRSAREAVERARREVAAWLDVHPNEVVFTSGGTESIHSALVGAYLSGRNRGRTHIVTTAIEHHAVLHTCQFLESLGASVTYVPPQADGRVRVEDVLSVVQQNTVLVSVMAVNNELGSMLPVEKIAEEVKRVDSEVLVHSDMVQSAGARWFSLGKSALDLASFSAHKLHGPKGVGALFVRQQAPWTPVLRGGEQEQDRRAGTENVPGIVGFGMAAKLLKEHGEHHVTYLQNMRERFLQEIGLLQNIIVNSPASSAASILNVAFVGIKAETLLIRLDLAGVMASAGSACAAGSLEPSHVLLACGLERKRVAESVRFSFAIANTPEEVSHAGKLVREAVEFLRHRENSNR